MGVVTPSGIEIEFTERPRGYLVNRVAVPSVTQVLSVLAKPALTWWGMTAGIEGFCELAKRYGWVEDGYPDFTPDDVVEWLKRERLTVNHLRNKGGDRGKYVHQALEVVARDGEVPDSRTFPKEGRGYVKGLGDWYGENAATAHQSEVLVASVEHGFAGTFDLLCLLRDGRYARIDAKTSKRIYPEFFLQLEAYELAAVECGYPASDVRIALRVGADGSFEAQESHATSDQFLAILGAYKAVQEVNERVAA